MNMVDFIRGIPKADLHMHVEAAIEPEMALQMAARNSIDIPYTTADELSAAFNFQVLDEYLELLEIVASLFFTKEDFYQVTYNYLKISAADKVLYADLMFDPQAHMRRGISFDTVVQGIHKAQVDAEHEFGIKSQLIMNFQRNASIESAEKALSEAMMYREWIVAVGLDNVEVPQFYSRFDALFKRAREAGFKLTAHCDVDEPNSVDHIRGCLDLLKVDRLDHGINTLDDESLIAQTKASQICITPCPTTDWSAADNPHTDLYLQRVGHGIKKMLDQGLCVTVNTDGPGTMGNRYMNQVLLGLHELVDLSKDEVVQLMRNAFSSVWVADELRDGYLSALREYIHAAR